MRVSQIFLAAIATVLVGASAEAASVSDEDFTVFFKRFIRDARFRAARITYPLPADLTSQCEEGHRSIEKWNRAAAAKNLTVPLTHQVLADQGLEQRITEVSSSEISIFQFRDEADSYLITYRFRLRNGKWYLIKYEDASC